MELRYNQLECVENMQNAFPKKVELHVHLDGSVRHSTVYELARKKGLPLPGDGTFQNLVNTVVVKQPKNLAHFLSPYKYVTPVYQGDVEVLERIAYEYCEDAAKSGIVYAEVRYSPHKSAGQLYRLNGTKGLEAVVEATNRGLRRGSDKFGIKVKTILTVYHGWPNVENPGADVIKLCHKYKDDVVGLDVCTLQPPNDAIIEEAPISSQLMAIFEEARKTGIRTTIHAGEVSGPQAIYRARYHYFSDRVGHGYHVVKDAQLYSKCLDDKVHFECCPYSSHLTGAVPINVQKHPIAIFAEDNANFSISTDDPTLTGKYLNEDYALIKAFGLTDQHVYQANVNAAKASFLPEPEKNKLVEEIVKTYFPKDI